MRVLVDTNVILSSILHPEGAAAAAFTRVIENHELVLSDHTMHELRAVFDRKFPQKVGALGSFIDALSFVVATPPETIDPEDYPDLRDPDDLPILASAVHAGCDCLITGDKDLLVLSSAKMQIVTPAAFTTLTGADREDP